MSSWHKTSQHGICPFLGNNLSICLTLCPCLALMGLSSSPPLTSAKHALSDFFRHEDFCQEGARAKRWHLTPFFVRYLERHTRNKFCSYCSGEAMEPWRWDQPKKDRLYVSYLKQHMASNWCQRCHQSYSKPEGVWTKRGASESPLAFLEWGVLIRLLTWWEVSCKTVASAGSTLAPGACPFPSHIPKAHY